MNPTCSTSSFDYGSPRHGNPRGPAIPVPDVLLIGEPRRRGRAGTNARGGRKGELLRFLSDRPTSLAAALAELEDRPGTAVLIDARSIDVEAHRVVGHLRKEGFAGPVLVLNARSAQSSAKACFDAGADVVSPAGADDPELQARLRACMRRYTSHARVRYRLDDLTVEPDRHLVQRAGRSIHVTPRELLVLERLFIGLNRVVTRRQLAEHAWDGAAPPTPNLIHTYVSRLRRKIDRDLERKLIHTVKGHGYVLAAAYPRPSAEPVGTMPNNAKAVDDAPIRLSTTQRSGAA